jgi:hypothetical protein
LEQKEHFPLPAAAHILYHIKTLADQKPPQGALLIDFGPERMWMGTAEADEFL